MELDWQDYGRGRNTGAEAFALLPEIFVLRFSPKEIYLYNADTPGRKHVQRMTALAKAGSGLTTYVNRYIREKYAFRIAPETATNAVA